MINKIVVYKHFGRRIQREVLRQALYEAKRHFTYAELSNRSGVSASVLYKFTNRLSYTMSDTNAQKAIAFLAAADYLTLYEGWYVSSQMSRF